MAFTTYTDGILNANSYIDVAYADGYHLDRGSADWSILEEGTKESLLIKATDYVDTVFFGNFIGIKKDKNNQLEFPRINAVNKYGEDFSDEIPEILKKAISEYALYANKYDLNPPINPTPTGTSSKNIKKESVKLDVIERSVEYVETKSQSTSAGTTGYIPADKTLSPLLKYPNTSRPITEIVATR